MNYLFLKCFEEAADCNDFREPEGMVVISTLSTSLSSKQLTLTLDADVLQRKNHVSLRVSWEQNLCSQVHRLTQRGPAYLSL